jgi:Uma2 family endonuclease
MPVLPDAAAFEVAPDWVCEVLSPATAATDRADKMPIFAAEKVQNLWFIDPVTLTLEAYRLEAERYTVLGSGEVTWSFVSSHSTPCPWSWAPFGRSEVGGALSPISWRLTD